MDWMLVSNIALWIGFLVMVLVNLALARQIGVLYERVAPAGALMMNRVLAVGDEAPQLTVPVLSGGVEEIGKGSGEKAQLLFFLSPDSRMEFVHSKDVGLALANAVTCAEAWGKILLIGGGPANQMTYRDYIGGSMQASGLGKFPDEAFGTIPSSLDWLDTEESQRLLGYQKHSYQDFLRDRKASLGFKRYLNLAARPVIRRKWLKHSPFYKANVAAREGKE